MLKKKKNKPKQYGHKNENVFQENKNEDVFQENVKESTAYFILILHTIKMSNFPRTDTS